MTFKCVAEVGYFGHINPRINLEYKPKIHESLEIQEM